MKYPFRIIVKIIMSLSVVIISLNLLSISYASILSCNASVGLRLLNSAVPSSFVIQTIMTICDEKEPNNPQTLLLHAMFAKKYATNAADYASAIAWLIKAKKLSKPNDITAATELAQTYEFTGELKLAAIEYQAILKVDPNSFAALMGSARIATNDNNLEMASNIYEKILKSDSKNIGALVALGRLRMTQNKLDAAEVLFNRVLAINPFNREALIATQELDLLANKPIKLTSFCEALLGFRLLNTPNPQFTTIENILAICDKQIPNDEAVLLLHGLLERKKALKTKNYTAAISWIKQAVANARLNDINPLLELAVTYEWAGDIKNAKEIYKNILNQQPSLRSALLGSARVAAAEHDLKSATDIYNRFLAADDQDIDAINGLARVSLARQDYKQAKAEFSKALMIDSGNADAAIGLKQVNAALKAPKLAVNKCQSNEGLQLLALPAPPYGKINAILRRCDKLAPTDSQGMLLHGLLARKQALSSRKFSLAIYWLKKAANNAPENNLTPILELAVTDEWAQKLDDAKNIYIQLLKHHPMTRAAWLGLARVYRYQYQMSDSKTVYRQLLASNSRDTDALNGLGLTELSDYQTKSAARLFRQVLNIEPGNVDANTGMNLLSNTTPYFLGINQGKYTVEGESSGITNINFSYYFNATNQLLVIYTHNTNELQLSSVLDPTLLPKNSVFMGFQQQFPSRYGWGVNFEYRERSQFRVENRIGVNANYYIFDSLQWFGGARDGLPSPWNNKLYYTGLNILTNYFVDFGLTGYWGRQQFGGSTSAYVIDLRKEYPNRAYYDAGASYSPSQLSWEIHGRFIIPISKLQGVEGNYEHQYFNGASVYTLGWRINW